MLLTDIKIPDVPESDILYMDRNIIAPLEEELEKPVSQGQLGERLERQTQAFTDMLDIDMPYLKYNRGTLMHCWFRMFQYFDLIEKFQIDQQNLQKFLVEVSKKYRRVPFHNMTHAFNVTHVCFYIIMILKKESPLTATNADLEESPQPPPSNSLIKQSLLSDLDVLIMILACIGHDLDHPGLGNSYFQKAKDNRALTVNNSSILENYHLYILMGIIE